jgi:hypothetical protein
MIVRSARRFNVVCLGRRSGKTTLGINRVIAMLQSGQAVAWAAPTYRVMQNVWKDLVEVLHPVIVRYNQQQWRIEVVGGGFVELWSLEKSDSMRGRSYALMIIDEAATVPRLRDTWQQVIRPTLADCQGGAWFLSTPKGRNFFWECWKLGQSRDDGGQGDPSWASWQMSTHCNPYMPTEEIDAMRRGLPEMVFQQEVNAQFIDDHGGVFRNIYECATAEEQTARRDGHAYVIGVDWGRTNDSTVFAVVDMTMQALVHLDRFQGVSYPLQIERLTALAERFRPVSIVAERNAMGGPLVELLQRDGLPLHGFDTTNASKARIIEQLALSFERQEIAILMDDILTHELLAYESQVLAGGAYRYQAPSGEHDDTVMALALAWDDAKREEEPLFWRPS